MSTEYPACPCCGGREFEVEGLGMPATVWKITFGNRWFHKRELEARACKSCGYVSLFVQTDSAPKR